MKRQVLALLTFAALGLACSTTPSNPADSSVVDAGEDATSDASSDVLPDLPLDQRVDPEVTSGCRNNQECVGKVSPPGPCQEPVCDTKLGTCSLESLPDGTGCDDQNACTQPDNCQAGLCAPGENTCDCSTLEDCAKHEDNNLCNGTLICKDNKCVVDELTIVDCKPSDKGPCLANLCAPETGACEELPAAEGEECDDQDPCTEGDYCEDGECYSGVWICPEPCGNQACAGGETCKTCPADCGVCPPECGDQSCNGVETCSDCPADCGICGPKCPDSVCGGSETCVTCPADCGVCSQTCGDGVCTGNETCRTCPSECGECPASCGNQTCDVVETCGSCPMDCGGCPTCGDMTCLSGETCLTCPGDCGACESCGDGVCQPGQDDCVSCYQDCGPCPFDCCTAHASPACDQAFIKACVCQKAPDCCTDEWSIECVGLVEELGCGTCPEVCGNGICSATERCDTCPQDCGACPDGCCWPQLGGLCEDPAVTDFVCLQNPSCCQDEWSLECMMLLREGWPWYCCGDGTCNYGETCENCVYDCTCSGTCGDGTCNRDFENCQGCPRDCGVCPGDCCAVHHQPGCSVPEWEASVCDMAPECCTEAWYPMCVELVLMFQPGACCGNGQCGVGEDCHGCVDDCGFCDDACCGPHAGPGCSDLMVETLVCQVLPLCCAEEWYKECVALAHAIAPTYCCGDSHCGAGEDCVGCPEDCPCPPVCGDGECDLGKDENCALCPNDCGECALNCCQPGLYFGCGESEPYTAVSMMMPECLDYWSWKCVDFYSDMSPGACCGNDRCESSEGCQSCPSDCGTCGHVCGDLACTGNEDCANCPADCGACDNCCQAHLGVGCSDFQTTMCVCQARPDCCTSGWSDECAAAVQAEGCGLCPGLCGNGACEENEHNGNCPSDCGPNQFSCCLPGDQPGCADPKVAAWVCSKLPHCCTEAWNWECVQLLEMSVMGYCCGDGLCSPLESQGYCDECLGASACCSPTPWGECYVPDIRDCVCNIRPECCTRGWTESCVVTAIENDCAPCPTRCGNGVCQEGESCQDCPADCGPCEGSCCEPGGAEACTDPVMRQTVCGQLPALCCGVDWPAGCAGRVDQLTVGGCCGDGSCQPFENCQVCPGDCGLCPGDCCSAQATPGCEDPAVTELICSYDWYCCMAAWDEFCVKVVGQFEPERCCGDGICGDSDTCKTCPQDCGACPENCCEVHDGPGCGGGYAEACVCALAPECCVDEWSSKCVEIASDQACAACVPECGDGACTGSEGCKNCQQDCGPCSADCCEAHEGGGCSDASVAGAVCTIMPFCCSVTWTEACAARVNDVVPAYCCGDGQCGPGESCKVCVQDCGICAIECGINGCQAGETCTNCPEDCGDCSTTDCGVFVQCLNACSESYPCYEFCVAQASQEALALYQAIVDCVLSQCFDPTDICVQNAIEGPCKADYEKCVSCDPVCSGKECGADGCGGTCGECGPFEYCSNKGQCIYQRCGDLTCDAYYEDCGSCPGDCGPCPSGCCFASQAAGCSDPAVAYSVCQTLPECCLEAWSSDCATMVEELDPNYCCGNGMCSGNESCDTCPLDCGVCPPELACAQAVDCLYTCGGYPDCPYQCAGGLPPEALEYYQALIECAAAFCPFMEATCFSIATEGVCKTLYDACLACDVACYGAECGLNPCGGSCGECPVGTVCSLERKCAQVNCGNQKCEEWAGETCSTCSADCGECPLLDCAGVLQCAIACSSPSCIDNCVYQGTPEAQNTFSALYDCVMMYCLQTPTPQCFQSAISAQCPDLLVACVSCAPQCGGKACGPDGCGGECGTCGANAPICSPSGTCGAVWGCGDFWCDPSLETCDSCPQDCGPCPYPDCQSLALCLTFCGSNQNCRDTCLKSAPQTIWPKAEDVADCLNAACQPNDFQCFMSQGYGACWDVWQTCTCIPNCYNRECGPDDCGGTCGQCASGSVCTNAAKCGPGCGDGVCQGGEFCETCPQDCDVCPDDCCTAHNSPGCRDGSIAACVCYLGGHMECCNNAWSETCVQQVTAGKCGFCQE